MRRFVACSAARELNCISLEILKSTLSAPHKMFKKLAFLAAFAATAPAVLQAQFLTSVSPLCNATNEFSSFDPTPVNCSGAWNGNDANQQVNVLQQLNADFSGNVGVQTWSFLEKRDVGFAGTYFKTVPNGTSGTIEFQNSFIGFFALGIKAGNSFSFYLFQGTGTGISSISYVSSGSGTNDRNGSVNGLSHASLYRFEGGPTSFCVAGAPGCATVVPEPTTYALMASGLLGIFGFARRRRNNA